MRDPADPAGLPGAVGAADDAGEADDGDEGGRTSRHSDCPVSGPALRDDPADADDPDAPGEEGGAAEGGAAEGEVAEGEVDVTDGPDGADESAASRDDGAGAGDGAGVKEGLRSAGVKIEGADRPAFADGGGGAISEPGAVTDGFGLPCPALGWPPDAPDVPDPLDASSLAVWSLFTD